MEIMREDVAKVLATVDAGLVKGVGQPIPGQMCVEAAVCYALGLPHGDDPQCVSAALRALKINLNDAAWSSPSARAAGLRRLSVVQLGSRNFLDDKKFAGMVADMAVRQVVPRAVTYAADANYAAAYANYAADAANSAADAADAADAANSAADAAARAAYAAVAARATARAANSATYAARATASATASAATYAAASAAYAADAELAFFAEVVVKILIIMDVPGVQWLALAPLPSTME